MKRALVIIASLVLLGTFLGCLGRLFQWRFALGDIHPPYSTLRADPLGAKAFYESLAAVQGLEVRRHLRAAKHLPVGERTTLFLLGLSVNDLVGGREELLALEQFAQSGGRLVLAFSAGGFDSVPSIVSSGTPSRTGARQGGPAGGAQGQEIVDLRSRWGFEVKTEPLSKTNNQRVSLVITQSIAGARTEPIRWHTEGVLFPTDASWQMAYARETNAVVLERALGSGSVVLCTDSFPLSNESLRSHRTPGFLTWLVGSSHRVLFDETHLGIRENPGAASLARRYHLELPFFTLCVLAVLFVWRAAASFQPRCAESDEIGGLVKGRDLAAGFVSLLRRNIGPKALLGVCLHEWKESRFGGRPVGPARLARIQEIIDRENNSPTVLKDPARVYQEIAMIRSEPIREAHSTKPRSSHSHDH